MPAGPRVVFAADVGGAVATQVATSPDEKTLYVSTLGRGERAGALVALERDGRERFRVDLGGRSYASPAVAADGTVYVGSDAKQLFAVGPDGHVKHRVDLGDEVDTSPLILPGGDVVVCAGKRVVWLDARGNVKHRFEAKRKVYTSPALVPAGNAGGAGGAGNAGAGSRDLVVVGAQDDHVYGLAADSGELVFAVSLGSDVDGSPAVGDDGVVVVGTDGGDVVRIARDGRVLGRVAVGGYVRGPLSVARNGDTLVGTYGPAPKLVRLRGDTIVGLFPIQGTGAKELGIHGGPLEDALGTLYFGAQDDHVYGVATNGELVFDLRTGGDVDAPLTLLSDGTLIVPSEDGHVYAVR